MARKAAAALPEEAAVYNGIAESLEREDARQLMLDEHRIVANVSTLWRSILEPGRKQRRDASKQAKEKKARK